MARYTTAVVKKITSQRPGLIRAKVSAGGEERSAVCYPGLTGSVAIGDRVVINTTARDLDLGSGGFDVIVWNLEKTDVAIEGSGHIMKLRYTPLQINCLAVEEPASDEAERLRTAADLAGMPVIAGTLHSQLPAAAAVFKRFAGGRARLVYIMTDRAALPLHLSDTVRELCEKGIVDATITCGQAFGGDHEAVNIYSALVAAKLVAGADAAVVTMGIGVVGTETFLGFSGIEQGEIVNAAHALKGRPIAVPRINTKDARLRHQGLSDQTVAALGLAALAACDLPVPRMEPDLMKAVLDKLERTGLNAKHHVHIVAADETLEALEENGLAPTTMGRSATEEPEFFRAAGAAGYLAAQMVAFRDQPSEGA